VALAERIAQQSAWLPLRAQLLQTHPELAARDLVKQRGYASAGVEVLTRHGATHETAVLASGIAAACFQAGQAHAVRTGKPLPAAVDAAFRRLAGLDSDALRQRLAPRRTGRPARRG
jgi:hypothetical protein